MQRAPVPLTLVRQRAQPTVETIVRLTVTAVFAYLLALPIPSIPRPVLAPLTALLVAQVSTCQTLRSGALGGQLGSGRPAGARAVRVGRVHLVEPGIAIALGLAVGYALHLREEILKDRCDSPAGSR
jgi:hypothetical protein